MFTHLILETIGACNRTCTSCLRQSHPDSTKARLPLLRTVQHQVGYSPDIMSEDLFYSIIDQTKSLGFKGKITLQFFNEPLLDSRLETFAQHIRTALPDSQLWVCSNADLLTRSRALGMDGLFHRINVALYMPPSRQQTREAAIRSWFKKTEVNFTKGVHLVTHFSPSASLTDLIESASGQACTTFLDTFIVNWNGEVSYCCDDVKGEFQLGNLSKQSIHEIWYSEKNQSLNRDLSFPGGRLKYDFCKSCPRVDKGVRISNRAVISKVMAR